MKKHIFIPDPQIAPGVPINHIFAAANYIVDQRPDVIVIIGDWWDMGSLSSYENKGSKYFHDKTYLADVACGNDAFVGFMAIIDKEIARRKKMHKKRWNPRIVFCMGNHENRITRAVTADPILDGTIGYKDLACTWYENVEVHNFLDLVEIDGILYSHYLVNQKSLRKNVLGGTMDNKLAKVMKSFSMGHQQIRQWGTSFDQTGKEICGLVAGAFYQHDEDYMGPQGNHYWRGIVVKHEVDNGTYDPMFVSLDYLLREWS